MTATVPFSVVVPTIGRPGLGVLLRSVAATDGPPPERVVVVDDRRGAEGLAPPPIAAERSRLPIEVVATGSRGPAAARNAGWVRCDTEWVVFLDDDVHVSASWGSSLQADLAAAEDRVAGIQGRIVVPLPAGRRPTDAERGTAGLASARWITADMAYRRADLAVVGGFDERFPRAFREDADLALRVLDRGRHLARGSRTTIHPAVASRRASTSMRAQRGNADDALMRRVHGADWHARAGADRGALRAHALTTALAATGLVAAAWPRTRRTAWTLGAAWLVTTGRFALGRIRRGPLDRREVTAMLLSSAVIPPLAVWHRAAGERRHRRARPWREVPLAILFDRDGTLVEDVPYNGDPAEVRPVPGAREALDALRAAGIDIGVVTNQSGVARGLLTRDDVTAVNARIEELLGPIATWQVCPHGEADGCGCRKPRPDLVHAAAAALGVPGRRCLMVGDTAADVAAGKAAGVMRAVLVPNAATRPLEIAEARDVAASLGALVAGVLDRGPRPAERS